MRRTTRLVAGAMALTLLASACGDDIADDDMTDGAHTFRVTPTNTSGGFAIAASGAQAVPLDATDAGPAVPGSGYEFTVPRSAGNLSFASMFVQTNDWFWSPGPDGLPLVDTDGNPVSGDVTDFVSLWDAGTEADQTPGEGFDPADDLAVTLTPLTRGLLGRALIYDPRPPMER